jgi:transposase
VRISTAFNRMLRLPGASVTGVSFAAEGVIVTVRLRRRRRVCSECGQVGRLAIHDRRRKRWRHLDLGASRCMIECELRRLWCRSCGGPRLEPVPWARPGSAYTRDFEDLVAFLAQQMAKTPIARLLRIAWETVGRMVERVVSDHLDERRLCGLVAIGGDEISYRKGQRYLTCVADHATGAIVWMRVGRSAATLQAFFGCLGERKRSIRAVSIDMSAGYENAVRAALPDAEVCFDPFHVVKLANEAVNDVRRADWNAHAKSTTTTGKWLKGVRWALLKAPERLTARQQTKLPRCKPPTARSTAPTCSRRSCGRSTTSTTPLRPPRTSRPGWPGRPAPSSSRSCDSHARSAATATASWPRSASDSQTLGSRGSTPRSASSATAASASTGPTPSLR